MAAFPSISTSRTPPSGQGSAVVGAAAGALRTGAGSAGAPAAVGPLAAVGPGAALGAGGAEHPATPATPASTPAATSPGIPRRIHRFAIIR
ncbi:hypothetical protein ACFY04_03555 [Streptomyces sp. NPDC001549]|uniref:hypothetical protein n=1 Tax=Streptomyces sp. NPDC001549 TaxID=3364586 RepID=UPI0036A016C0